MRSFLPYFTALFVSLCTLTGCSKPDITPIMDSYLWKNRVIIIFSPNEEHEAFTRQMKAFGDITTGTPALKERDIVTITLIAGHQVRINGEVIPRLFTAPFYEHFEMDKDAFALLLIGKDGEVKLRSMDYMSPDKIFRIIDSMPMRRREMQQTPPLTSETE